MEKISNIINLRSLSRTPQQPSEENATRAAIVVNALFADLKSIFPAFKQAWPGGDEYLNAKRNWVKAFQEAGINTIEQLRYGLKRCRACGKDFVISPGKFISWCNPSPEDIGLPSLREAYQMSVMMNAKFSDYEPPCTKTHAVLDHIIKQIGASTYRSLSSEKAFKIFDRYYPIACKQLIEGRLSEIVPSITEKPEEHPDDKTRSNIARLKAMEQIRQMGISVTAKENLMV